MAKIWVINDGSGFPKYYIAPNILDALKHINKEYGLISYSGDMENVKAICQKTTVTIGLNVERD